MSTTNDTQMTVYKGRLIFITVRGEDEDEKNQTMSCRCSGTKICNKRSRKL